MDTSPRFAPRQAAPTAQQKHASSKRIWTLLVILAVVIWWAVHEVDNHKPGTYPVSSYLSQVVPISHTQVIANTAVTVTALGYEYYKFVVPPGSTNISLAGRFSATGGTGNDIQVIVLDSDGFVNFQNGHSTPTYYNSGKLTQDHISAVLPRAGTYYLVLNNNFSLITPKAVQIRATLHYTD